MKPKGLIHHRNWGKKQYFNGGGRSPGNQYYFDFGYQRVEFMSGMSLRRVAGQWMSTIGCLAKKLIGLRSEVRKLGEVSPTNGDVSNLLIYG